MTIAHYTLGDGYGNLARRIKEMTGQDEFWVEVRKNVVSWAIIGGLSAVGWMAVNVPNQLNRIILNQEGFQSELRALRGELNELRANHEIRLRRLEETK